MGEWKPAQYTGISEMAKTTNDSGKLKYSATALTIVACIEATGSEMRHGTKLEEARYASRFSRETCCSMSIEARGSEIRDVTGCSMALD